MHKREDVNAEQAAKQSENENSKAPKAKTSGNSQKKENDKEEGKPNSAQKGCRRQARRVGGITEGMIGRWGEL